MLRRFFPLAIILSFVFRLIFFLTEAYLYVPEWCTFIFAQRRVLSIILALVIAAIDAAIYSAGQKLTEMQMKYPRILDGAFIKRDQEKERKKILKAAYTYDRREYEEAISRLDSLLGKCSRSRDYYAVYCLKGLSNAKQKQFAEAAECWKKAIENEKEKAYGYAGLAYAQLKLKMYNEAIENGKTAIRLDKDTHEAYDVLCIAFKAVNDEENFEVFYKAVKALGRDTKYFNEDLKTVMGTDAPQS